MTALKKGSEVELVIERFGDRGKSISHVDGMVVFVQGGVPGDRIRARIFRKKRQFAEALLLELLDAGPERVEARCRHFGVCGGCKWQHVDYSAQLDAKRQSVIDAFRQISSTERVDVRPIVEAEQTFAYRNKMEFSFSAARWLTNEEIASGQELDRSFALGLHVPGNFEKVLDLEECHLMEPWVARLVRAFRELARSQDWPAWNVRSHEGYLRHLVVRASSAFDEALVNLVVATRDRDREAIVADLLSEQFPEVTTFVTTLNTGLSQTSYGDTTINFGPGYIREQLGEHTFKITPAAFFQTNTRQAGRLYEIVRQVGSFESTDRVYDLYCGAGTIAMYVSSHVAQVVGVEVVAEAVEAARQNALDNNVNNVTFEGGDMLSHFGSDLVDRHGPPDVVIVDPPRPGLHPKVVERIADMAPERLVYVSCNPRTMARDIEMLLPVFSVDVVVPVDMFPHTHHTEAVARLTRRS